MATQKVKDAISEELTIKEEALLKAARMIYEELREQQKAPVILLIDGSAMPFQLFGYSSFEEFERDVEECISAEYITGVKNAMKIRPPGCTVSLIFGTSGYVLVAMHGVKS